MQTHINPPASQWEALSKRPTVSFEEIEDLVKEVFDRVASEGDKAVLAYTQQFDRVQIGQMRVSADEMEKARHAVGNELKAAIGVAKNNIEKFHAAQKASRIEVETTPGVLCWQEARAIEKVGLYIPGGTAPLFSTLLMLAIPARLAGCKEIVLCSPPDKQGKLHPAILYAAQLCGVTQIYKVGGIQAIAALTHGTETLPKVYKIFGPGNQFVTVAKQYATKLGVAIDMPAGPSEVLVVADKNARPDFIAADLLSQAEHGKDSQVVLVTTSADLPDRVTEAIEKQLLKLPRREIAQSALSNSMAVIFEEDKTALDFINQYAPEHFIVQTENNDFYANGIMNAGSVFMGAYTPESAGDYASGTNHTLPTHAYARQYSGVNLDSFLKKITFQHISPEGLRSIGPVIEKMAAEEGLQGHKNAVSLRLKSLKTKK